MDSRALRLFRAVAEHGSVSAAAQSLHTVQSNVTAHIKRLEVELGLKLFYRKPRGVELTPAGAVLLGYARRVLQLLDEAGQAVQEAGHSVGRLRLGTLETLAAVRLPPVLARFRRAFPDLALHLSTGSSAFLCAQVLEFQLDGAFIAGGVDHPQLEQIVLHEEELVLVSVADRRHVPELRQEVLLVFPPGCAFRARTDLWLQEEGLFPLRIMEVSSLDAMLGCVCAGMGVAVLPRVMVQRAPYRKLLRLHPLPERYARLATGFIRHRQALETRAVSALVALAGE